MIWTVVLIVILALVVAGVGALSIVLARRVVMPRTSKQVTIHDADENTVTLSRNAKTAHAGEFGLWFGEDGHARVGRVLSEDTNSETITRELLSVTSGDLQEATSGLWTGHVIPSPTALERSVQDVQIPVEGGQAPAWLIKPMEEAPSSTWAIHIHGIRTTRITALRSVPAADKLGCTSLVVSFRSDTEGPDVPKGGSTLGLTEWPDVDAAIAYAREHGAQRIVLFAWSMGASIALLLTERSAHRDLIAAVVLIAPATDWRTIIRHGAAAAHLPAFLGSAAIGALSGPLSSRTVGISSPIDFDALDFTRPGRVFLPTLVIHSEGDNEVPVALSRRFQAAHPEHVSLVEIPGAAHAWEYNVDAPAFEDAIVRWALNHTA